MKDRTRILKALEEMPDEAFGWVVMAMTPRSQMRGADIQIWPDGIGGFSQDSKNSINICRNAAEIWLK